MDRRLRAQNGLLYIPQEHCCTQAVLSALWVEAADDAVDREIDVKISLVSLPNYLPFSRMLGA